MNDALELWHQALRSPNGIAIVSQKPMQLMQKLYAARKAAFDPRLAELKLLRLADEVWIVPRDQDRRQK